MLYLTIKSLHVVSAMSWMAGLLYLPRLFVYHAEKNEVKDVSNTFKTMEYKLYNYIMYPAMILTWITGLFSAVYAEFYTQTWFLLKFGAVILMTVFHIYLGSRLKEFALDQNRLTSKAFRFLNEVPTLLMIFIVVLVIVKPFT